MKVNGRSLYEALNKECRTVLRKGLMAGLRGFRRNDIRGVRIQPSWNHTLRAWLPYELKSMSWTAGRAMHIEDGY